MNNATRIAALTNEIEIAVREVEHMNPAGQPAKDRWKDIEEKAGLVRALQAEMDKAVEAVADAGLSIGQFKQGEWYNDRRQQLAAMQARH